MKFLFDIAPVLLFFITFKFAEHDPTQAISWAERFLGPGVTATTAPVFLATAVAIIVSLLQVLWVKFIARKKVDAMLWISLAIIVIFGGLTLYLKNELFIKWKPTILYWVFAGILVYGQMSGKNFIRMLMKGQIKVSDAIWNRYQFFWIVFFVAIGIVNLIVAYAFDTDFWVNFKLFGLTCLTLIFTIVSAVWLTKHVREDENVG